MRTQGLAGRPAVKAFMASGIFLLTLGGMAAYGSVPVFLFWFYLAMSALTFGAYARDKAAARQAVRRTRENTLHLLSLLGGWPGALYARELLRHKTTKQPFRAIFWMTLTLNLVALGYFMRYN